MLKTRLLMGAFLVAGGIAVLWFDDGFTPYFPIGMVYILIASAYLGEELRHLVRPELRSPAWLVHLSLAMVILSNWPAHIWNLGSPWHWLACSLGGVLTLLLLYEAWRFRDPGGVTERLAINFFIVCYIAFFFSFLIQLRWMNHLAVSSTMAMALCIFLPKVCDSGAYFTGRAIGKHKMTPILSPKKTWEGAIGGIMVAVIFTFIVLGWPLHASTITFRYFLWVLLIGIVSGIVGIWGDLVESLIKRDLKQKDAGQSVPGFGGLLDVFDSILFSAPVIHALLLLYPGP